MSTMKAYRTSSALLSSTQTRALAPLSTHTSNLLKRSQPHRTFLSNPFSPSIQTLTATRTVPYDSDAIYSIISDVSSYSHFLPFCVSSTVTKTSSPDSNGHSWPEEAQLTVGFASSIREHFWSRVYCDGHSVVEAVSGTTDTTLPANRIAHHSPRAADDRTRNDAILTHLLTRWTLRPFPYKPGPISATANPQEEASSLPAKQKTEVNLFIEYAFANPVYGAMSKAASPKVAGVMMEAFEKRVREVLEGPGVAREQFGGKSKGTVGSLEGVLRPRGQRP